MELNKRLISVTILAFAITLALAGVALGFYSIVVDGAVADWGPLLAIATHAQGGGVPDNVNFQADYATADATKMYFRFDTWGSPTRWTPADINPPFVYICMDVEGNGQPGVTFGACNNQPGVDYILQITGSGTGAITPSLFNCTTGSCVTVPGATLQAATAISHTEASVLLSDLNFNGCPNHHTINTVMFFDNQDLPPDPVIPGNGTAPADIPCPTAVSLSAVDATSQTPIPALPFAAAALVGVVGAVGTVIVTRRRK